jgi:NADPH:quinone reductase
VANDYLKGMVRRAIRFDAFGDPSVLKVAEVPAPTIDENAALVRVMSASINPSEVKNVAGAMRQTTLPRIPGRDFAGVVEAGPSGWIGAEVWGTGGDTGFTRDGTHAELIAVPVASLRRKPKTLSFDEAASVGVNYMAAWCGIEAAGLQSGETVLLIGAGGGVGSAAAQIARRLGARVIGADRRAPRPNAPINAIADALIIGADDLPAEVRAATGGKGADVILDLVGGVMFRSAVNSLGPRGRLVEIAATGQREVSFDLADFYHNESRLFGVDTLKRDLTASAEVLDALTPGFVAGDYRAAPIEKTCGLGEAREAYRRVAAGATGRIVLLPRHGPRGWRGLWPRPGAISGPSADRAYRPARHGAWGAGD